MKDIHCARCREKLGWQKPNAEGVTILCHGCGFQHQVGRGRVSLPMNSAFATGAVAMAGGQLATGGLTYTTRGATL